MTSLSRQLKRLALPQTDPDLFTRKEVASLLFEPKDAAVMDRSTFYALGRTGLEELLGIEPALSQFQQTLFSAASLTLERSIQTKETNQKLDSGIKLFLTQLSPYFLLKPAHKCLEWLVHRFHIHLYNVDSLVACALPYHDTKVFVRVIQLLKIKEPTNKWNWLHCLQKPGVPLSRLTLVTHCYKDLGFMDFICNIVTNSVQAYSDSPGGGGSQLRVIFSFFASTIVSALDSADRVTDAIITKLLPYVQKGLKSSLVDFRASSLMILCGLSVKVDLDQKLVQSLCGLITKSLKTGSTPGLNQVLLRESLGALIVLLQNQEHARPTDKSLDRLILVPDLVPCLGSMSQTHDVSPLLRHLLPHLMNCTFNHTGESLESSAVVLENFLTSVPLTKDLDLALARLLLRLYLSQTELSEEHLSDLNRRLLPIIRAIETRYSRCLEQVISDVVAEVNGDSQKTQFHQFLSLSVTSGKFQLVGDSSSSLLLSLNHPQPSIRVMALDKLRDIVSSGQRQSMEEDFLKTSVLDRLKDHDPGVVSAALKLTQMVLDLLDPEETVNCLISLLHSAENSHSERWWPVVSDVVCLLSDPRLGHMDADSDRLLWKLLPFLVFTSGTRDSARFRLGLSLAQSPTINQHSLTSGWSSDLETVMQTAPDQDLQILLNQALVSNFTKNLRNMETFSRRHTMDSLCSCVELLSQSWSGSRPGFDPDLRTSLLVLIQTLVLGVRELSDTHHLLTARRVYRVLERHLLEINKEDIQFPVNVPALSPSSSFSDWLGVYLSRCEDDDGQVQFSLVLLSVLSQFVSELKSPDDKFKDEVWWNLEHLDTNTCCYLSLLSQVFALLMGGASNGPITAQYRQIMKMFVQVHLGTPLHLFRFLCLTWSQGGNPGDQVERCVLSDQVCQGAVLQTQALIMGSALMEAQSPEQVQEVVLKTPVFLSVLVVLCSRIREVRRAGLNVLRSLSASRSSPFQPITERLLKTSEEIMADHSYLSSTLGSLYGETRSRSGSRPGPSQSLRASFLKLLDYVQVPCCPSFTASALLRALSHVNGEEVLSSLLPAIDRLLSQLGPDPPSLRDEAQLLVLLLGKYSPEAGPLLVSDKNCRTLFLRALKTTPRPNQGFNIQLTALEQISKAFFSTLDEEVQQSLLSAMFDILVENPSPQVAHTVSSVFKQILLDAQLLATELSPPEKPSVAVSVQQTRRTRMLQSRRAQDSGVVEPGGGAVLWHRVTLILELLQHKKKLKRPQALVPVLFNLLTRRLEPSSEEQASVEYTKQLLLSCLLSVCNKLSPEGQPIPTDVLDPERFSVELVVQCIRSSEMSQTHHQALLLLSAVAPIYPEKVLLNIMPIFTFMGANIMRLDDAYSFRVIDKTVQMVIPAIIKSQDWTSPDSQIQTVVSRVVHVFVDALPHVPDHRRVPVLDQLLKTIGPERFLWVLLALLFKQHAATNIGTTDKDSALEKDLFLWTSVCSEFDVKVQIQALVQILVFLRQLPQDKEDAPVKRVVVRRAPKKPQEEQEKMEDLIFDVDKHSSKELRHFKYLSVSFSAHLLASERFISKVSDLEESGAADEALQQLQQKLLEEILGYIHSVAQCVEQNADKPTAKYWRVLLNKNYDLLDKVNALLHPTSFITVTRGLMGNEVSNVRRKALELLNNKLQQKQRWDQDQVSALLSLLSDLQKLVHTSSEPPINRQTALFSLKLLCRQFGPSHQDRFVPVMQVSVSVVTATEEDCNVMATALQCVAESVTALRALAIPHLPVLMPGVLSALSDRKDCLSSELYLLSAVTALHRVTETLPNFISPYLHDTLSQVCRLTRLVEVSSLAPQLSVRLESLRSTIASKVPSRVLLPTVCKVYTRLLTDQKNQLVALMSILKEHISHMDKDQLTLHQSELTSFFLMALDFRALHCQCDLEKAERIEGSVIDCLLSMVLKLSEVTFRPLFFKLFEWSKVDESSSKERLLTFYRLTDSIALKLKSLFVLFAGNLVKPVSDLLRQTQSSHQEPLFPSDLGPQKTCLLLKLVLNCLQKIFLYATDRFLSRERAEALMGPLVDQLENLAGGEGPYRLRVTQDLVPCLGQFSVALDDDSQKALNYQVLLKTRQSDQKVRVSSLLLLEELCSKLKENYMVLLPETIPFLAELMEDESEEVEKEVQRVVQQMENVLGEPLQSYF